MAKRIAVLEYRLRRRIMDRKLAEVRRERETSLGHVSIMGSGYGGRGFGRDTEASKSENGFSH